MRRLILLALLVAAALGGRRAGRYRKSKTKTLPMSDSAAHSLHVPPSAEEKRRWVTDGHARFGEDSLVLTEDEQGQRGRVWSTVPLHADAWEATLKFKVHGQGKMYGDGFALWYVKEPSLSGPAFGAADQYKGLGVFFDTYDNGVSKHKHEHPYVSVMVNDGSARYLHGAEGTKGKGGGRRAHRTHGCHSKFRFSSQNPQAALARLSYSNQRLSLSLGLPSRRGTLTWSHCFTLKTHLPTGYVFGLSSSTGDLTDKHEIVSFEVQQHALPVPEPVDDPVTWESEGEETVVVHDGEEGHQEALDEGVDVPDSGSASSEGDGEAPVDDDGLPKLPDLSHVPETEEEVEADNQALEQHLAQVAEELSAKFAEEEAALDLIDEEALEGFDDIAELQERSPALQELMDQADARTQRLVDMQQHLTSQLELVHRRAEGAARTSQRNQKRIINRLKRLEKRSEKKIHRTKLRYEDSFSSWVLPLSGLVVVVVGIAGYIARQYRKMLKTGLD